MDPDKSAIFYPDKQPQQDEYYPQEVQNNYSIAKQPIDHSFILKEFTFLR
jgi:hypothetical protein